MNQLAQLQQKPEIYYSSADFSRLFYQYSRNPSESLKSKPYKLLLSAKACFFMGKYRQCLQAIQGIQKSFSTKILYERQALLIKASYLQNPNDRVPISNAYQQFLQFRNRCPGLPLIDAHSKNMVELIEIIDSGQSIKERLELIDKQGFSKTISQKDEQYKLEGMYSYLVSKKWMNTFNSYSSGRQQEHPGPITNFEILNHVFEFQAHKQPQKVYLNTLLFPGSEGSQFEVLTRAAWLELKAVFGGFAVQRMLVKDRRWRSMRGDDTTIKTLIELTGNKSQEIILQWQRQTMWQKCVLPYLTKLLDLGQLKQRTQSGQYLIVQPGKVSQPSSKMKYVPIPHEAIKSSTQIECKRKKKLMMSFDLEQYELKNTNSHGRVGLQNLGNTCYMNSGIQCLSHILRLTDYFVCNKYLSNLRLSDENVNGSFGLVTCALADILKRLWLCEENTRYIDPTPFKKVFGERFRAFNGYEQQDAQQFLMFLINCMHDDLNQRSQRLLHRESTTNRDFDEVLRNSFAYHHKHNNSIISTLFHGFHSETTQCDSCQHEAFKFEDFIMIHVQIPETPPELKIYFVSATKGDEALQIIVQLQGIQQFGDVLHLIQKQLQIPAGNSLRAFYIDEKYYMLKEEIKNAQKTKKVSAYIEKSINDVIFVYEICEPDKDQEIFLVTYHYEGRKGDCHEIDGFPRLVVCPKHIKEKNMEEELEKVAVATLPRNYQSNANQFIANIFVKNAKGFIYQSVMSIKTKFRLRNFKYQTHPNIIGNKSGHKSAELEICLRQMTQSEAISEQSAWVCFKCKKTRSAHRTDKIYNTADILLFDFKRFTSQKKIQTKVLYPVKNFDMTPFLIDQTKKWVYNLKSVILHRGSLDTGHYTAYCHSEDIDKWFHYDDETVSQVKQSDIVSQNAYILAYQRSAD